MSAIALDYNENQIRELSMDEADEVNGGLAVSTVVVGIIVVVAAANFIAGVIDGASGNPPATQD